MLRALQVCVSDERPVGCIIYMKKTFHLAPCRKQTVDFHSLCKCRGEKGGVQFATDTDSFLSVWCVVFQRSLQLISLPIIPKGRCCLQICTAHPSCVISAVLKVCPFNKTSFRRGKRPPPPPPSPQCLLNACTLQ